MDEPAARRGDPVPKIAGDRLKVLHVIDSGGFYGAEAMLIDLMTEQRSQGIEPVLCSIGCRGFPEKEIERRAVAAAIPVERVRMRNGPNFPGARRILERARALHSSVIHLHGYKGPILFGFLPRNPPRIPLVATLHGFTWTGGLSRMLLYEWANRLALKRMDAVVAVSRGMTGHPGLRRMRLPNLRVIPNGIVWTDGWECALPEPDPEIEAYCRRGGFVLGTLARLSAEKGLPVLVEALGILAGEGRDLRAVILGKGRQQAALETAAACHGLGDRVLLPGYRENGRAYLQLFDAFVLPSLTEGMPVTLLEAMFAGVPIIASRVGGIPELLRDGEGGELVAPGNAGELASAIRRLMDDRTLRERYAARAREHAVRNFGARRMAERYTEVYRSVLGGREPGRTRDPASMESHA